MTSPRRLGRYELLEPLGEGGMGAVWLARLSGAGGFEKLCLVKTVLPALAKDPSFVSRFLHEGRVLTQLSHSNIAQVFDMGEEDGQLYLALEYVAGIDLARLHAHVREQGQALPVPLAVYLVQQAAEGLGSAHRKAAVDGTPLNIVHRDVSPQNVMVSYEGEVKVIDFGIAKSDARSHATQTATVMGKLGYMAPEQANAGAIDHRADQYALGVVLWELLANRPFVPRGTLTEMVAAMARPAPKPLAPLRPEVPASLETVVLRALSPEVAQRFPSTDDFARALLDELLALSGMPSKVQIGELVKSYCPSEFQSSRALLTRVSTIRGLPTAATPAAPTSTPAPPPVTAPEGAPMTTAQLQAAAMPPSRVPLLAGAGLLTVMALLVVGYLASRPAARTETPLTADPVRPVAPIEPVAPPPPAPTPTPEPVPAIVPPVQELTTAAAGDVVESKKVVELFVDGDKTYVRAGKPDGLVAGQELVLVGAPQSDGKRLQLGTATVMEVFPKMARVALDAEGAKAEGPRFAALGDVKVKAAPAPSATAAVEVKKAVELFKDADKVYARAGQPDGLVVGQTVVVVSGPLPDGTRTRLGTGTVMEVFPKMARLALDADAAKSTGDRFVALGEVKEVGAATNTLTVKAASELFADGDKLYVRAGKAEGLVAGQELVIVGPPLPDGKRTRVGTATVMEVQDKLARLLLDADAGKATGPRFAALDASGAVKPAAGTGNSTPAPAGGGAMTGKLKLQTTPVWAVFLENTSKFEWKNCTLYAPGQRRMFFPTLMAGARREFAVQAFVFDPTAPNLANEVQVSCKQGTFRIPAQ